MAGEDCMQVALSSFIHFTYFLTRPFLVGITARTVKVGTACAMMISSYEHFKAYFRRQNVHRINEKQLQAY